MNPSLKLSKPLLALILSLVIALSVFTFVKLEKNSFANFNLGSLSNLPSRNQLNLPTFPTPSYCTPAFSSQQSFEDAANETQSTPIDNATRADVYEFIVANPGVQFRGICAGLDIAIGTAEFHLGVLKKAGLISFVRDGKFKRFFASKRFSQTEMRLLSLLRHETARAIIKKVIAEKAVNHSALASHLFMTSQGLTWQMSRLKGAGIVQESYSGIRVTYSINEAYTAILPQLLTCFA